MAESRPGGRRHLNVVPTPADSTEPLFEPSEPPESRSADADRQPEAAEPLFPPGVTAAQIRETLVDAGAPDDLLAIVDGFGDDLPALAAWLADQGYGQAPEEVLDDLLEQWNVLLRRGTTPLDAELCGVEFLWMFHNAAKDTGTDVDDMLGELVERAATTGRAEALAMARVLTYLGSDRIRRVALDAAHQLASGGAKDRPWVRTLGKPSWVGAFGYADPLESQASIALGFQYGTRSHACVALIDHGLGGGFKDIWFGNDTHKLRAHFQLGTIAQGLQLADYSSAEAAAIIRTAAQNEPCPETPDEIEDVGTYLPLLLKRLELLPDS